MNYREAEELRESVKVVLPAPWLVLTSSRLFSETYWVTIERVVTKYPNLKVERYTEVYTSTEWRRRRSAILRALKARSAKLSV